MKKLNEHLHVDIIGKMAFGPFKKVYNGASHLDEFAAKAKA